MSRSCHRVRSRSRWRSRARCVQRKRHDPAGERPAMERARTMKLRERADAMSQARCSLTNPGKARRATLWAAGIKRCAGPVRTKSRSRAPRERAKATPAVGAWLMKSTDGSGGVMAAARKDWVMNETGEALLAPGRKLPEQGTRRQRRGRSEGGCWARSSGEPPVTRWDSAKSRRTRPSSELGGVAKGPGWSRFRGESEARRP